MKRACCSCKRTYEYKKGYGIIQGMCPRCVVKQRAKWEEEMEAREKLAEKTNKI